jgi:small GTP-binding protein
MLPQKVWNSHPTSDREMPNLPPEIWSNILSFLSNANFDTFFRLKQVSHLFNQELKKNLPDMSWLKIDNIETKDVGKRKMVPQYSFKDRQTAWGVQPGETNDDNYYLSKITVFGPSGVGKSTFWRAISTDGNAGEYYPSNIGVEFCCRTVQTHDNISNKLQIWDTAGAERFRVLSPSYLRGSKAILFMFALDDRQSLVDLVNVWFKEVVGHYIQESNVVLYLVGLKVDKVKERAVTRLEAEIIAKRFKLRYFEASGRQYGTVLEVINALKEDLTDVHTAAYFEANPAVVTKPEGSSRMCSVM